LFDQADDGEDENQRHRNLRCYAKRAKSLNQGDLNENQIGGKEKPDQ
jgi:hypothetical protein